MGDEEWMEDYDPVAAGEQTEDGTDLEGIRYNLTLTVAQRIEQHRSAMESILWLRKLQDVPRSSSHR